MMAITMMVITATTDIVILYTDKLKIKDLFLKDPFEEV